MPRTLASPYVSKLGQQWQVLNALGVVCLSTSDRSVACSWLNAHWSGLARGRRS